MCRTASTMLPEPASPLVRIIAAPSPMRRSASPRSRAPQTNGMRKANLSMWKCSSAGVRTSDSSMKSTPSASRIWASTKWPIRALAITGIETVFWISLIFVTEAIRATPPSLRISAGTRPRAHPQAAPPASAPFARPGRQRRTRRAQRAPAAAVHEERRARRERDAALDRRRQDLGAVEPGRQREEEGEAALRFGPRHLGRHAALEGREEERTPPCVFARHAGRVTVEEPALTEPVDRGLDERARVEGGELLGRLEALEDRGRCHDPAEAEAG